MSRIEPINYEQSTGKAKDLLDAVKAKLGMTPNMMKTMANSPAVLEAYLNFSGAGEFWERPNDSLDAEIKALLEAGQKVANAIGPWDKERPAAPTNGNVRLNMLTPSGLHFGYGGFETLSKDPMGAALINPATALMLKLTQLSKKK